jgi:ferrous iron transport protein B
MLAPFMPCGAKIPLISLFAGVFFENSGWVSTLMYLTGIIVIYFGALLVNKITAHRARKSFFIIELPEYKMPSFLEAFKSMCSRGVEYIVKAATVILICNTAVQIMQTFDWSLKMAQTADVSILATVAKPFAFMLLPVVGVLSWQLAAAAVTGFIAKENVVGTLAVCFSITNFIDTEELQLIGGANEVAAVMGLTKIAALAYLMFNLFSPPCFAAMGAMNSEMKSAKWLFGGIALQLGMGFSVGYLVYTIGTIIIDPSKLNITAAICGGVAIALMLLTVAALSIRASIRVSKEKM